MSESSDGETLVIVDFDDTLVVSSKRRNVSVSRWKELESVLIELYDLLKDIGQVIIVTNATAQHINTFCGRRMPDFNKRIRDQMIFSARETYQDAYPDSPATWKIKMVKLATQMLYPDTDKLTQVIGIGDKSWDRDAVINLSSYAPKAKFKHIKLMEIPNAAQIQGQHAYLIKHVLALSKAPYSLDYVLNASVIHSKGR